jgi:hypothetical protein
LGLALRTAQGVPPDIRYLGIRAREIVFVNAPGGTPNAESVTLISQIDKLFFTLLIMTVYEQNTLQYEMTKSAGQVTSAGPLYVPCLKTSYCY